MNQDSSGPIDVIFSFFLSFFLPCSFKHSHFSHLHSPQLTPVISPPPIKNLWVVCGVNLNTEVSYYYKSNNHNGKEFLTLDPSADRYSNKKLALVNPRGLFVAGGNFIYLSCITFIYHSESLLCHFSSSINWSYLLFFFLGVAYETKHTYQPTIRRPKSGDGTVPYSSMNHASTWRVCFLPYNLVFAISFILIFPLFLEYDWTTKCHT